MLLCYSTLDGKLLWSQGHPYAKEKKHARNTYATSTPAVDMARVYTLWQSRESSQLLAYDHAGQEVWRVDLGPYQSNHGGGLSPIVVDGLVVVNNAHEGDSFLLGVEAATGKERWRVPRARVKASYSTPCVYTDASGKQQLIFTSWKQGITSIDPASGSVLWETSVFEPDGIEKRAIGSPVIWEGVVYGTCGFTNGQKLLVAVKPPTLGGGADAKELFSIERGITHMPSTLLYNGRIFNWTDAGIVYCFDAKSGESIWQKRLGGNFSGSPICVDDKLYCLSDDGEMVVIAAADEFQELGRAKLDSGSSSTPAVSDGIMYFRTDARLYSLGGK
jgi:outer membrane protein assembly factor BamB